MEKELLERAAAGRHQDAVSLTTKGLKVSKVSLEPIFPWLWGAATIISKPHMT